MKCCPVFVVVVVFICLLKKNVTHHFRGNVTQLILLSKIWHNSVLLHHNKLIMQPCWNTFIADVNELKVFVDLAMIRAGETDLEMDRVSCFHGAAMGYAPIIFGLKDESGSTELLEACKKLWTSLENDPELPLKLVRWYSFIYSSYPFFIHK